MCPPCKILEPTEAHISFCAQLLKTGQLVGLPTETVYGLAGNALNEIVVRKIFEVKGRPLIDPLIVHFPSMEAAKAHVWFNETAHRLASRFWPGALTMVLPKKESIPDLVTAGLPSLAVRVSGHPVFRSLLQHIEFPLAAPSANPFGYVSPTLATHVRNTLGDRISTVLDGGPCEHGIESTIVDLRNPETPQILRPGPISAELPGIELTADKVITTEAPPAPGMLARHYSPHTVVRLFEHGTQPLTVFQKKQEAVIFNSKPKTNDSANVFWLSENGNPETIAHNLFALLQKLDRLNFSVLHVERTEPRGLGVAINDRLQRASKTLA